MFNLIEKNQKVVKGIMIAVTATFVLWGIGGYLGATGDDGYVAKVGGNKIYTRDIDNAIQQNPQNTDKMQVLLGLINRQLLLNNFDTYHMSASKEQLQKEIANVPSFQDNGKFSMQKYQDFLSQRSMTAEQFQVEVSEQVLLTQTLDFFKSSYFTSDKFNQQFAKLLSRERNVSSYVLNTQAFYPKTDPTDADINSYYKQNIAKFTLPEQAKVQYLQLSTDSIIKSIKLSDDEINKYIADHKTQVAATQIDVSHILLSVPADANAQAKAAVYAKAQKILAEVKANPSKFAELAKQYSEDPISAQKGGDLGYFGKGIMAKPFEDVAFDMKPGQISQIVETQYGYHILKLNDIKTNDDKTIRDAAVAALQKQKSASTVQKQLELLNDLTYNQPTSLEPAAKKLGLTLVSTDWIKKGATTGDFANPKIQQAIFNKDVISSHNNSEVIDLGHGIHAVYRINTYQAARVQTLAEIKPQLINEIKQKEASMQAYQEGQKNVADLQSGKLQLSFVNPQDVTLLGQSKDINPMVVKQIFSVAIANTPAYTGSINDKGDFVIYRINSETIDPKLNAQNKPILAQLDQNNAMLDVGGYVGYLRTKYSVSYKVERLTQAQQPQQQQQ